MDNRHNSGIKALPVWWHGYRFRSRLEGRWAVFFERIGLTYEYEPQGFHIISDGTCYLPDFWLPQVRCWAEAKPTFFSPGEERKCELISEGTGNTILMLTGPPNFANYPGITFFDSLPSCCEYSLDIHTYERAFSENRLFSCPMDASEDTCSRQFKEAVYASRSARFDEAKLPELGHEPFNLSEREMDGLE